MSIYITHRRRNTSNALDTLVLSEQECFQWTSERLVTTRRITEVSRHSAVQRQRRTDDQVSWVGNAAQESFGDDWQSVVAKAVTRIFSGGCHVELERRRREDRGAVGWGLGKGCPPPQKIFAFFYFKMVSFCACLHGFQFGIFLPFPAVMPQAVTNHYTDDTTSRIWLKCNSCVLFSTQYNYVITLIKRLCIFGPKGAIQICYYYYYYYVVCWTNRQSWLTKKCK